MLVSLDEIYAKATKRHINLDNYDDKEIEAVIAEATGFMESETGLTFEPTPFVDDKYYQVGGSYIADHYPIISIEKLKINDNDITTDTYRVNKESGIIYFHTLPYILYPSLSLVPRYDFDLYMEYTVGMEEIPPLVSGVCRDLVLSALKYDTEGLFGRPNMIKERDNQISFNSDDTWLDINNRLSRLVRPRMVMI
jgi:hypothetical protein